MKYKRFETVFTQGGIGPGFQIVVDKITGVNYLLAMGGYGYSITPLLDSNGNVVISKVSSDNE